MTNEKELQKEIVNYLKTNYWEVKEYVPRKDCLNWEHPYQADLLIRHSSYKKLGWIGIEIKDHHKVADAFQQIITKYQNHYFDSLNQPINIWAIIVNSYETDDYSHGRNAERSIYLHKFGVGILNWKNIDKYNIPKIIFNHSLTARGSIYLAPFKENLTDESLVLSFVLDKCQWVKSVNKSNMGFVGFEKFTELKNKKMDEIIRYSENTGLIVSKEALHELSLKNNWAEILTKLSSENRFFIEIKDIIENSGVKEDAKKSLFEFA